MRFLVEEDIFKHFPGMRIVTVVAKNIKLKQKDEEIDQMLKKAWRFAANEATAYGNPQSHPSIKPWAESMKKVGAPRKKFPSSIEALARRASKSESPVKINPLVDFYNAVSLKNMVPAGGYDLDEMKNDMVLRFSAPGDSFLAMDSEERVGLSEGEICYADGQEIITRHFVWKQSRHAILSAQSKNVIFVSEVLEKLPAGVLEQVCQDLEEGLKQFFDVETKALIVSSTQNSVVI